MGDVSGWDYRIVEITERNPRMQAGRCKILLHEYLPGIESSIWMDGNLQMRKEPSSLLDYLEGFDFVTFEHPHRDCLYEEAEACRKLRKWHESIPVQIERYREEGYPEHAGLAEVRVLIRRNIPETRAFCENWWAELLEWSDRSQISLPYLKWKLNYPLRLLPVSLRQEFFKLRRHANGR